MNANRTQDRNAAKPWVIDKIRDRGPGQYYRFQVQGFNLWTGEAISWSVPSVNDSRYDLAQAQVEAVR